MKVRYCIGFEGCENAWVTTGLEIRAAKLCVQYVLRACGLNNLWRERRPTTLWSNSTTWNPRYFSSESSEVRRQFSLGEEATCLASSLMFADL